ncbi:UDP-N-acetylglucosamine pyrophosphorylase [Hokovirus HKV1]|uniref:UDP-N-acetylglucosamine diphosphorylase n=1 Tax=Hokovirus HKV1 TaxID=1977638 RepID=A0A1V0SFS6_9VIRU|nr:UDP-N-acetylglucosamine pyrophosphorylase [Hokovirus HKV1]
MDIYVTILCGGKGSRMNSDIPKVLHKVKGQEMVTRIINEIILLNPKKILIIVNNNNINQIKDTINETINKTNKTINIKYIIQKKQLGTGDAVKCSIETLKNKNGINLIINGDMPLIKYEIIQNIINDYVLNINNIFMLITGITLNDPGKNGRIFIEDNNVKIIEYKDCNENEITNNLINVGIYCVDIQTLINNIIKIDNNNAQNEYYLTDLIKFIKPNKVHILENKYSKYILGVNDINELEIVNNIN